jgi:hypothetical protein
MNTISETECCSIGSEVRKRTVRKNGRAWFPCPQATDSPSCNPLRGERIADCAECLLQHAAGNTWTKNTRTTIGRCDRRRRELDGSQHGVASFS